MTSAPDICFSIVTPSLNQGVFIESTIKSVLGQQGDFRLEYIVVDGGSQDQTLDILRKYDGKLQWISERDGGQAAAVNKGFHRASGNILGWINSDDLYAPGALEVVASAYRNRPFSWCFGNCRHIDQEGREIRKLVTWYKNFESRHYSFERLLSKNFIPQPTVFLSRDALFAAGPLDERYDYAMDYDLWLRLGKTFSPCYIDRYLATFRWHKGSKSNASYKSAARQAFRIACRHSSKGTCGASLFRHRIHVLMLYGVYLFL